MNTVKLLDCTLRDGGYINDWNFGKNVIHKIKTELATSGIEIIELGFLRDEIRDENRAVFNNIEDVKSLIGKKPTSQYAVMAEVSNPFPLGKLAPYTKGAPEIIRVIIWKRMLQEGFEYCKGIVEKGYKLCVQPARVSQYSDSEFVDMIQKFNTLNPLAIYVVDSWGTMDAHTLLHYLQLADENLKPGISVGYHGHNNLKQAFDVAKAFCTYPLKRDLMIDTSVYGIGRGAGNLDTEQFLTYANENLNKNYNISPIQHIYHTYISKIYETKKWGHSIPYAITAKYNCNPSYADYLSNTLHVDDRLVEEVIQQLSPDDKIIFSAKAADDILYKLRKAKCSTCIVIPTRNRVRFIKNWLDKAQLFYTYGTDIWFVDSSDNQDTENLVKNCPYKNVFYARFDDSKRQFKDTLDEKVYYALSLVADKYDWSWPCRDRTFIHIDKMYTQLFEAKKEKFDLITIYYLPIKKNEVTTYDYTDRNQYLLEQFGNMMTLGSMVFCSRFLKQLLTEKVQGKINVGLWIPVAIFHCIANKKFKAKFIKEVNVLQDFPYDAPSFWFKDMFSLWTKRYPAMIENLPACYTAEKEKLLTFTNFPIHPFCWFCLLISRAAGAFTFKQIFKNRKILKKMSLSGYFKMLFISLIPAKLLGRLIDTFARSIRDEKTRKNPIIRFIVFMLRKILL